MNIFKQVLWRLKVADEPTPTFSDVPMGGTFRKKLGGCVYIRITPLQLNGETINCIMLASASDGSKSAGFAYRTDPSGLVFPATVEITA
jgi:hypothetical protein